MGDFKFRYQSQNTKFHIKTISQKYFLFFMFFYFFATSVAFPKSVKVMPVGFERVTWRVSVRTS